jgi:hypothetical protein
MSVSTIKAVALDFGGHAAACVLPQLSDCA